MLVVVIKGFGLSPHDSCVTKTRGGKWERDHGPLADD